MNRIMRVNQQGLARLDRAIIIPRTSGVRGRWKLEAVNAGDGRRRFLAEFHNLITNVGLDLLAASGGSAQYLGLCCVGSGNTAPSNGDTALVALVASTSTVNATSASAQPSSPYFGTRTNTYRFAMGAAAGNLAEIGIGHIATNLFSRALILDGGGSPTTITVLSSEFLDCTYTFEVIVPLVDVTGTVTIAGVSTAYTLRAANSTSVNAWCPAQGGTGMGAQGITAFSGAIGAITTMPAGTPVSNDSIATASYTPGSLLLDSTGTFGLNSSNFGAGGVQSAMSRCGDFSEGMGDFQVGFTPAIAKDNTHIMTLTMRNSWVRM